MHWHTEEQALLEHFKNELNLRLYIFIVDDASKLCVLNSVKAGLTVDIFHTDYSELLIMIDLIGIADAFLCLFRQRAEKSLLNTAL